MASLARWTAIIGSALAIAAAVGCGAVHAQPQAVSPCGTASLPAWSPDGTQIVWYGKRWPQPNLHHASGSIKILRAFCVSDADGKNVHPLAHTTCSERCTAALREPPAQLYWVAAGLLYGSDAGVSAIPTGGKAKLVARTPPNPFSSDTKGDRVAAGVVPACTSSGCAGPVKVFSVPSGALVGKVGGSKVDNSEPSLSPDGKRVVLVRTPANDSGKTLGIWTASVDGSNLARLVRSGDEPLWSPAGDSIAYLAGAETGRPALRVVAPQGGSSRTLVPKGVGTLFSWSPDGGYVAFADSKGRLEVVNAATKKVRTLLKLGLPYGASSVAWSPDSKQLLVVWKPPAHSGCPSGLWSVPVGGGKPRLVHGC